MFTRAWHFSLETRWLRGFALEGSARFVSKWRDEQGKTINTQEEEKEEEEEEAAS